MKLVLIFLFGLYSCNAKKTLDFPTFHINNSILLDKITRFIAINSKVGDGSDIIISSNKVSDTTVFYLVGDRRPNFKENRILGCIYVNKVLIWLQGEEPDVQFISIDKSYSNEQLEVDIVKNENEVFFGHPLQWTLEFKGNTLVSCKSNSVENCEEVPK
ncbi:MAG: hypothetical protein J0M10_11190 [Chitinophagales bacterium]|nr:hypothetical protein [Chitinophagales bacterium]